MPTPGHLWPIPLYLQPKFSLTEPVILGAVRPLEAEPHGKQQCRSSSRAGSRDRKATHLVRPSELLGPMLPERSREKQQPPSQDIHSK